jgi:alpha-L-fucosidase
VERNKNGSQARCRGRVSGGGPRTRAGLRRFQSPRGTLVVFRRRAQISLVHDLVDIVSKNGNLLLNVGPKPDGTIPPEARERLIGLGQWLRINGEAIYGARHWQTFGEGSTTVSGHMREHEDKPFNAQDICFTSNDQALYAICLGWPGDSAVIKSLGNGSALNADQIASIEMLGSSESLSWSQSEDGLHITTPRSGLVTTPIRLRLRSSTDRLQIKRVAAFEQRGWIAL